MPFKHYIQKLEGKEPEVFPLKVIKSGSQYCVELPDDIVERCRTLYPGQQWAIWGIWCGSVQEAIRAYELATDEELMPASTISGRLRYSAGEIEYV